jgi:opacity protein-like surface antigen
MNITTKYKQILLQAYARKLTTGLLLLACSSLALADDNPVNTNWSVGAAIGNVTGGQSMALIDKALTNSGVTVTEIEVDDSRTGWKLNIGFNVTENIVIEAGYVDLNEVSVEFNAVVINPDDFFNTAQKIHPTSADGFTVGSVYHYGLSDSFNLTGSIGLFRWDGDFKTQSLDSNQGVGADSASGTDVYFGLGAGYQLSEDVTLDVEWERYKLDDDNAQMWSVGVNYSF